MHFWDILYVVKCRNLTLQGPQMNQPDVRESGKWEQRWAGAGKQQTQCSRPWPVFQQHTPTPLQKCRSSQELHLES